MGDEFIPDWEAKSCIAVMMAREVVNWQAWKKERLPRYYISSNTCRKKGDNVHIYPYHMYKHAYG